MRKKITIILSLTLFIILIGFIFYLSQKTDIKTLYNHLFQKTQKPVVCQQLNQGLLTKKINDIAMTNDSELYAATDIGMFKSIDYGNSWHVINKGLEDNGQAPYITKVIIDDNPKYDRTVIYALVGEYGTKIFESTDKGMNWFEIALPFSIGSILDIDVAQGDNGNSDLYALSHTIGREGDGANYKKVYYFNHFIKRFMTGMSSSEFLKHYLETGSMVEAHWDSKPININLEDGSPEKLIMNDWNYPHLLTEYPYNLYRSQDDGDTWTKVIIDNDLSSGFINIYSTFSDSLPADGDTDPLSVLVQNDYSDNTITLYDFTAPYGKILSVPNERVNIQTIKIGENYLDTVLYYPYIGEPEKMNNKEWYEIIKNFHYYIPNNYQATYHSRNLNNTLFVASNEGVFACDLK